jgi:hypothetical protein
MRTAMRLNLPPLRAIASRSLDGVTDELCMQLAFRKTLRARRSAAADTAAGHSVESAKDMLQCGDFEIFPY